MESTQFNMAALCAQLEDDEAELVEEMIFRAAEYVHAVVTMETAAMNLQRCPAAEQQPRVASLDRQRTAAHNAFISSANIVNRICALHELPPVYTGDGQRRSYGDFAFAIVGEIYSARQ